MIEWVNLETEKTRGPVSQQMWHDTNPFPLKNNLGGGGASYNQETRKTKTQQNEENENPTKQGKRKPNKTRTTKTQQNEENENPTKRGQRKPNKTKCKQTKFKATIRNKANQNAKTR